LIKPVKSDTTAFLIKSILDPTCGSFADKERKCLVNAAKTARKPPNKVASKNHGGVRPTQLT